MMKRFFVWALTTSFLPALFSFTESATTDPGKKKKKPVQTIIIDPGHGGKDQGAPGLISTEAKISLEVGLKLGKAIEQNFPGVKVLYTRTEDVLAGYKSDKNQSLRWRADFANQSGADLFISIHCNSAGRRPGGWYEKRVVSYTYKKVWTGKGKKRRQVTRKYPVYKNFYVENKAHGTETYVWAARETDSKENHISIDEMSGENDSTLVAPDMNDPVLKAFQLLYTKKFFQNSVQLAEFIEQEFVKAGRISRGVKQRNDVGIWVLHATGMPSVLVETGFISNKEEEQYMNTEEGQEEIVRNITDALRNYIAYMEKLPAGTSKNKNPGEPDTKANSDIINRKDKAKAS